MKRLVNKGKELLHNSNRKDIAENKDYTTCPNCGHKNIEEYCAHCGQPNRDLNKPFKDVMSDLLDSINLDKRLLHTLLPFFFKPGFLTKEYFLGHRKRYVPPMRMYLFMSFIYFFTLGIGSSFSDDSNRSLADIETETRDSTEVKSLSFVIGDESADTINTKNADINLQFNEDDLFIERYLEDKLSGDRLKNITGKDLSDKMFKYMSYAMFFLMPFFALILKLLYIRRRMYYMQHLIFSINMHTFFFGLSLVIILLDNTLGNIINISSSFLYIILPIYVAKGMRRFYNQGYGKTIAKFFILLFTYSITLVIVLAIISVTALLTV
ncbi:MAG: DUF3667 domain-containing protein [Bacteroidales bacterium]|jgi:hypothetical protein|nr:DUF3667 domain-containing protein [Bacteroidales bacterium]